MASNKKLPSFQRSKKICPIMKRKGTKTNLELAKMLKLVAGTLNQILELHLFKKLGRKKI